LPLRGKKRSDQKTNGGAFGLLHFLSPWMPVDGVGVADTIRLDFAKRAYAGGDVLRWKYLNPCTQEERDAKVATLQRISTWWTAFQSREAELNQNLVEHSEWVAQQLADVYPGLFFEFGPILGGGERMSITPTNDFTLTALAEDVVRLAPKSTRWQFCVRKPPVTLEYAKSFFEARMRKAFPKFEFSATLDKAQGIELKIYANAGLDREDVLWDAFHVAEYLVGYENVTRWITRVTYEPRGVLATLFGTKGALPLEQMNDVISGLRRECEKRLPDHPLALEYWSPNKINATTGKALLGHVFQLQPVEKSDYPGWSDMYVASSSAEELWMATHCGRQFSSQRYSKFGESFCYLKIDGSTGLKDEVKERGKVEDAINAALGEKRIGQVSGGGSGFIYCYIELTLTDVETAIPYLQNIAREMKLPVKSWLLFHDKELKDEWVGLWPETPCPPQNKC